MSRTVKALISVAAVVFLALAGGAVYSFVAYRIAHVPTGAMANTIIPGDSVLCGREVGEIKRGG